MWEYRFTEQLMNLKRSTGELLWQLLCLAYVGEMQWLCYELRRTVDMPRKFHWNWGGHVWLSGTVSYKCVTTLATLYTQCTALLDTTGVQCV